MEEGERELDKDTRGKITPRDRLTVVCHSIQLGQKIESVGDLF